MKYTEEDLDKALDKLLIERGEHPTRVRNPIYGEERDLAKKLVEVFCQPNGTDQGQMFRDYFKWHKEQGFVSHKDSDIDEFLDSYLKLPV